MGERWPECDPDVFGWVSAVVRRLEEELGANLTGIYLIGSLAAGSFYPPKSDVDLLVVVRDALDPEDRRSLARMLAEVSASRPIIGGLECTVILAVSALETPHPMPFEVHFSEEWRDEVLSGAVDHARPRTDPDLAVHCHAVSEIGLRLSGAPIPEVFGTVDPAQFMEAVLADLDWILEPGSLEESPFYGVLNACRVLWIRSGHTARLVPSKEEAGAWARVALPRHLRELVEQALQAYRDPAPLAPELRKTAGRRWDPGALDAFRRYVRNEMQSRPDPPSPSV